MGKNRKRPDNWTRRAKAEGYAARSVYKLEEIQRRFRVLNKMKKIVDLGCAPGSWSTYIRKQRPQARLVGIDLQLVERYPGTFIQGSILETPASTFIESLEGYADLIVSDMAPNTTGNRFTDHVWQIELAEMALLRSHSLLRQGGRFVVKVFDGEDAHAYVLRLREHFQTVKRVKPAATRNESVEFFVVAQNKLLPPVAEISSIEEDPTP